MAKAICEDCGSLVEVELTHNGVCSVGHYVHCGWGHTLSPSDLIPDAAADRIEELEAKLSKSEALLAKAVEVAEKSIKWLRLYGANVHREVALLAELKGEK